MKTRFSFACILAAALGALPFTGGCEQAPAQSATAENPTVTDTASSVPAIDSNPAISAGGAVPVAEVAPASDKPEPVKSVVEEPTPANLKISPALAGILKMVKSGVGKDVLIAFANESTKRFALGTDEIIYLKDLGVADEVTAAMIDHDRGAREGTLVASAPEPVTAPTPVLDANAGQYAPQYQVPNPVPEPAVSAPLTASVPDSDAPYFYDALAPYGNWVSVPDYGLCWQPTVVVSTPDWRPYLDCGQWVSSDYGWYWASDYSWGWAPFHYGRWFYHTHHGWVWSPGRVWGPAWVSWRNSADYCGWAPLPPGAGFAAGVGFTWHGHGVSADFEFGLGSHHYAFVPVASFCDPFPHHYVANFTHTREIFAASKVVNKVKIKGDNNVVTLNGDGKSRVKIKGENNKVIFEGGAEPTRVETASHGPLRKVTIKDDGGNPTRIRQPDHMQIEGGQLVIHKPELPQKVSERAKVALAKVENAPPPAMGGVGRNNGRSDRNQGVGKGGELQGRLNRPNNTPVVAVPPPVRPPVTTAPSVTTVDKPRERVNVTRTPNSLVMRGDNTATPVRSPNPSTTTPASTPTSQPAAAATPAVRGDRPTQNEQPRSLTIRRSPAQPSRPLTTAEATASVPAPTPVPTTPTEVPRRNQRSQPVRVWTAPTAPAPPAVAPQPSIDRRYSPPTAPVRTYTPPTTSPSFDSYRAPRAVTPPSAPAYRQPAPAPAPAPSYSAPAPDRSRSGGGGGGAGGGGGGGGGGNNNRNDSDRSGRNR